MGTTQDIKIQIAPNHIPAVSAGKHEVKVRLDASSLNLSDAVKSETYHVQGNDAIIPAHEVLASYPPMEAVGNFAGTFPHIQFKRSTLPWDYNTIFNKNANNRIPYIHLLVLEEEEVQIVDKETLVKGEEKATLAKVKIDKLKDCLEDPMLVKDFQILNCEKLKNKDFIIPKSNTIEALAHVRIQEHEEIAYLNLPKETSILVSNRMVLPNKKYKVFVCYPIVKVGASYNRVSDLIKEYDQFVVLYDWTFESIGNELYQFDKERLNKIISDKKILEDLSKVADSNVCTKTEFENFLKKNVVDENLKKIIFKDKNIDVQWLSYFKYEGKNLKGMLTDLKYQTFSAQSINDSNQKELFEKLFNSGKVNLDHDHRAGYKLNSWYQGPLINDKAAGIDMVSKFKDSVIPDHADHLILFNNSLKMLDMTYAAAWQLGRLMIMTDVKVLQQLKKWKYEIRLVELMQLEGNVLSKKLNVAKMPEELLLFVIDMLKFKNFPIYYLLPHQDLNEAETIKRFKIDRFWMISFLFGIFSSGPEMKYSTFEKLILQDSEIVKSFDFTKDYYGIFVNSLIIKNWPHININVLKAGTKLKSGEVSTIKDRHVYKFVTTISDTQRLYVADFKLQKDNVKEENLVVNESFDTIEIYLKNENCHYAVDFPVNVEGLLNNVPTKYKPIRNEGDEWFVDDTMLKNINSRGLKIKDNTIDEVKKSFENTGNIFVTNYRYDIESNGEITLTEDEYVLLGASLFFKQPQFIYQPQKNDSK